MSLLNIQRSYVPFQSGSFMQEIKTSRIETGAHPKEALRAHNLANTDPVEKINVHTRQVLLGSELETRARWAIIKSNIKDLKQAIELGVRVTQADESGETLLHLSARTPLGKCTSEVFDVLVAHGADLDKTNTQGRSALHEAAQAGHLNAVKYLVKAGANTAVQDVRGLTALDLASMSSQTAVYKYLSTLKR